MAQVGHKELMRVMTAAGYTVETQGFPSVELHVQRGGHGDDINLRVRPEG